MSKGKNVNATQVKPMPNQRLPKVHFDNEGRSMGKQEGPVRSSWDAYQGPRPSGEEKK